MRLIKCLPAIAMVVALVGCGGGGSGSTATTADTATTTTTAAIPTADDFIFELDKTSIVNTGGDKAVLTVTVLNSSRNVVSGVPVSVAVDAGGVFSASSATTDSSGKFSGTITIGGNKINRTINATIKAGTITKVATIVVTGSQIAVTPVPATPVPGQQVTLNIATTDSAQSAIQFASLALSGTAGASGTLTTDASGNQAVTFNAPASAGTYNVIVTGLGVSTTKVIQVIGSDGSGKPVVPSSVVISSVSLNPLPTSIPANLSGSTTNRSKLSAKFLTTSNTPIENMRVRFEIVQPSLGNNEAISTGGATVYTNSSGIAEADYISGTRTSPTNGVLVRACYKKTDFTSVDDCPISSEPTLVPPTANLTVSGTPLSISISNGNTLKSGLGAVAYLEQFLIQVNDAAGAPVKDAVISASVDITHYGKGYFGVGYPLGSIAPTVSNLSMAFVPVNDPVTGLVTYSYVDSVAANSIIPFSVNIGTVALPGLIGNVWCVNEDKNRNGFIDAGEDLNGDKILQPRKAEIVVSYVNGNKTDANGQLLVQVTYGQNMGTWLAYTLRATTGVAGTEGDASKSFITGYLDVDLKTGSFKTPPFGTGKCDSPN